MSRRTYIDWLRGLAVLIMIEWHAVDAWTADDERAGAVFKVLAFLGGWAAPLFLFLAGVAIPLAVGSHVRKGKTLREAAWALQKRGWQVWVLAHVFRFQSYLLNPGAVWHSIFKPDILNILGLGMVLAAFCWGRSATLRGRMVWLLGTALLVLTIAPFSRGWWWPTLLHPRVEAYIRPNGGFGVFPLFPWLAFVLVGAAVGVWIAMTRSAEEDRRFHLRLAGVGLAAAGAGFIGMWIPSPLGTSFWTTSWSFFFMRTGAMILALAGSWLWLRRPTAHHWSPMVLFGQTSLFVYWVHVEMAYGFPSAPIKKSLTIEEFLLAYLLFTALLLWMAAWWKRRTGPWVPPHLVPATLVVLLLAGGTVWASQGQWRPVIVRLPAGTPADSVSACVTDAGAPGLQPSPIAAGEVLALCGAAGVARCSIPGAEPLDVDLNALCRGMTATVLPVVRSLVPVWSARDPVIVEWRTWGDAVSTLLATRQIDPAAGDVLRLAESTRLLRVLRVGASPVTLVVPTADRPPQDLTAPIPPAVQGGELFVYLDTREREIRTLTIKGPETRVVGINGATFLSVPGLSAGDYSLRFGSIDLPEGRPVDFTIRDAATTELVPRLPAAPSEVRISGEVTFNREPLARQPLEIVHTSTDQTFTTTTDDRGRYTLTVPQTGVYLVRVVSSHDFGQLEAQRDAGTGETQIDLVLAGAHVRLSFLHEGAVPEDPVAFVIEGPERFSGIVSEFSQPTELLAIPYGTYSVRASMAPNLVADALPLVIDGTPGLRSLTLDLREQRATLRVVDDGSGPANGVRARAGTQILRAVAGGAFDVRRVSPGTEIIIRAPGRVPACVILEPNVENIARLRADIAPLEVRFESGAPRVPPGRVRLADADRCTVPLEEFDWRRIAGGFEITNLPALLPPTYEYGSQRIILRAPGEAVVVR